MNNSYFLYTENEDEVLVDRFHICTWEFKNNSTLVEFGIEINASSFEVKNNLDLILFIPWLSNSCKYYDYYNKLKDSVNSRFIFNDSIISTNSLDGGNNQLGVVHEFTSRAKLCILPTSLIIESNKFKIGISFNSYKRNNGCLNDKPNAYIRFCVEPSLNTISTRKNGITRSSIIYDIKLNERRNIPEEHMPDIGQRKFCNVQSCFCFNIVPNSYDLVFFDSSALKNVRTLEYESFNRYLGDHRVEENELIVVFNKKKEEESYSFFSMYSKERIGAGQFALALMIGVFCGLLLYIPSYRQSLNPKLGFFEAWVNLPIEIYLAFGIVILTLLYFLRPWLNDHPRNLKNWKSAFINWFKKSPKRK